MSRFHGPLDTVVAAAELDAVAAVVREAVTNVAKHAQATELDVELRVDGNQLSVDVSDNGIGLGPNDDPRRSGLDNLKRRADIWQGTLTLTANQPHGTRLSWTIPLLLETHSMPSSVVSLHKELPLRGDASSGNATNHRHSPQMCWLRRRLQLE